MCVHLHLHVMSSHLWEWTKCGSGCQGRTGQSRSGLDRVGQGRAEQVSSQRKSGKSCLRRKLLGSVSGSKILDYVS